MKNYTLEELITGCPEFPVHQRSQYDEYMHTPLWRKKKFKTHRRDGYKCVVCGASGRLETHHLTYIRIYVEKIGDLVSLCPSHHRAVHEHAKKQIESPTPNWPSAEHSFAPGREDQESSLMNEISQNSEVEER
jgi:5-methylcytosine-specific restriction endonuclease McrA